MEQEVLDAPKTAAIKVYQPIEDGIALMLDRHGYILTTPPDVKDDAKALALAKLNRHELVKFRTTLEKARKAEKSESLAYGRLVDSEAARIQAFADPLELAYDKVIEVEETRLAHVLAYERELERLRIDGQRARIQGIKEVRETANMCRTAERLKQLIDGMPSYLAKPFEEFQGEAETAFNEVCTVLQQLHGVKVEAEAQAAELKRQQEEMDRQRTEQVAKDLAASQARIAEEATAKALRDAEAAELVSQRAAFEVEQEAARQVLAEQARAIAAQQKAMDDQKACDAAAAELLAASRPKPLTAQDIAEGVVDAEVERAEPLTAQEIDVARIAEINALFPCQPVQAEESAPTLRLGQIGTRLGFTLTAEFLRQLGFEPAGRDRAAVLYHHRDFDAICAALVLHISDVRMLQAA